MSEPTPTPPQAAPEFCIPPRGVIFDLDGTLFDSLLDIAQAANQSLRDCGFEPHAVAAYRVFVGDGVHVLFERALADRPHRPGDIADCAAAFARNYAQTCNCETRIYPGIPRLLAQLQAALIPISVLSNKPDPFVRQCVAHYFADVPFAVVAGQKADVPKKPDPAGALAIAQELGLSPGEVAFVGDSSVDVLTACNAGMWAIGCSWGFRPAAELWEHGARHVVDEPAQLAHLWRLTSGD
ncbi:MAG: HAD family hydrolase [Planctomycetaceae bacterium]